MTPDADPNAQREESLKSWDKSAPGWGRRAERMRAIGMPVSMWMLERLALQPGQRVLELAAGPGDTGFLAAELIRPGGTLICSDASGAMLTVARERARQLQIDNVEFGELELEWIDLPAAGVDAVLCRWGVMLCVDPGASVREMRRVLRPGGRVSLAVWDDRALNPWGTIPATALVNLGYASPPDPNAPGPFALAAPGRLQELLENAGFVEVIVEPIEAGRAEVDVGSFVEETLDISQRFAEVYERLSESQRAEVAHEIASLAEPFTDADGSLRLPGRSLVGAASA